MLALYAAFFLLTLQQWLVHYCTILIVGIVVGPILLQPFVFHVWMPEWWFIHPAALESHPFLFAVSRRFVFDIAKLAGNTRHNNNKLRYNLTKYIKIWNSYLSLTTCVIYIGDNYNLNHGYQFSNKKQQSNSCGGSTNGTLAYSLMKKLHEDCQIV